MYTFISISICMIVIPTLMIFLNFTMSKKHTLNYEKSTPFECGFDPASLNRQPFSIQFFLISLIFLIFDIEIALLIPLILFNDHFPSPSIILSLLFLVILIIGLYFEYLEKSMDWKI